MGTVSRRLALVGTQVILAATALVAISPATVSATSCTPGYTPCLANKASDVDCWGGSGNGPRYTKPHVTYHVKRGFDRYRLDADHDGLGCE
jgi:hypothetical protein